MKQDPEDILRDISDITGDSPELFTDDAFAALDTAMHDMKEDDDQDADAEIVRERMPQPS